MGGNFGGKIFLLIAGIITFGRITKAITELGHCLASIFMILQHLLEIYINYLWMVFRPVKTAKVSSRETLSAYGMTTPHVDEGYILELLL